VETDEDHFKEDDICIVARDILAEQLRRLLVDALDPPLDPFCEVAAEVGNVGNSKESLWHPLLALAATRINCGVTAEALLIRAGKWAPDKYPPELL
jgi:hypothetical protein